MRKLILLFITTCCVCICAKAQYWQQQVNYTIDVTLNDVEHTLDGFEKIEYHNNATDTLTFIWFHVWPNAYKNDKTAFSEQMLINNRTDFYFSNKEQRGYINRLDFKVNGTTAQTADHPQHIDIIKVILPQPLAPGASIIITTPFHIQLPQNFTGNGHIGQAYQIAQWHPKPAVYDGKGWHAMPYLQQGGAYNEVGNYNVRISLPDNYVVAATGELQNAAEKTWLKERANFNWQPITKKVITKKGSTKYVKKIVQQYPTSSANTKTLQYKQNNIQDFTWFADKRFIVKQDSLQLPSGKIIDAFAYYLPNKKTVTNNSLIYIKNAVKLNNTLSGDYPYNTISTVQGATSNNHVTIFPTVFIIPSTTTAENIQSAIAQQITNIFLQSTIAINERQNPWMHEGINAYYNNRYKQPENKSVTKIKNKFIQQRIPPQIQDLFLQSLIAEKRDQAINTVAENFTKKNYEIVASYKASQWMMLLEQKLGTPLFDSCMREYYKQWQFKHPYPEDFKAVIETVSNQNVDDLFSLLNKKGSITPEVKKQVKPVAFFNLKNTNKYNYLNILPAIGYNVYDGFMIGALAHNYNLPTNKFKFVAVPLYATQSKQFNYLAKASYTWFPANVLYKAEIGVTTAKFSVDEYTPDNKPKIILNFKKIVPFIRLTLKENDVLSKKKRYLQLKSFIINEQDLQFKTVITSIDTTKLVNRLNTNRYVNQLKLVVEDDRILYPYKAELQIEQADGFVRTAFTGNYYFNYTRQQEGLQVRLFAGKFFYAGAKTITKQFKTDRYQFNLTGANGYEDYTYSNYFVGRNKYEGNASQQIMMRDGFFKVRTDLLSNKIGKTDDWLSAVNFTSTIPKKINPLSILPFKIPIKIFADIGTFAESWKSNSETSKFLFDAGLQLSLIHETVNIYFPILYSKEYKSYFKSTLGDKYFWKTVSFSIDVQNLTRKKISKELNF